jgi:transmembrane sensor
MSKLLHLPDQARIQEAAAGWLIRLDRGELSTEEAARLREWLEEARHREALHKLARLWGQMDCLTILAELFPQTSTPPRQPRGWLQEHWRGAGLAAALSVALVAGAVFQLRGSPAAHPGEPVELVYETRIGEQSRLALKDGSTMLLNTNSRARVLFSERERAIQLTRGEAHFDVAKNPARPFVVYAGQGAVRATGTAFSVRVVDGKKVDVLVDEGSVEVKTTPAGNAAHAAIDQKPSAIRLSRGGNTRFDTGIEATTYLSPREVAQRQSWRQGKWAFEGETLAEVIAEVSRYTSQPIEITDPRIAALRIGGYFDINEVDALLKVLHDGFGVRVTRAGDGRILLSALDSPTP